MSEKFIIKSSRTTCYFSTFTLDGLDEYVRDLVNGECGPFEEFDDEEIEVFNSLEAGKKALANYKCTYSYARTNTGRYQIDIDLYSLDIHTINEDGEIYDIQTFDYADFK